MPVQSQLFPDPPTPSAQPAAGSVPSAEDDDPGQPAPIWLQRISLFVLVLFCIYLGVLLICLPWTSVWDHNLFMQSHPKLWAVMRLGAVRGIVSGLGALDIWIGISEAVHYRDHRA